jgi:hypothetical protein
VFKPSAVLKQRINAGPGPNAGSKAPHYAAFSEKTPPLT